MFLQYQTKIYWILNFVEPTIFLDQQFFSNIFFTQNSFHCKIFYSPIPSLYYVNKCWEECKIYSLGIVNKDSRIAVADRTRLKSKVFSLERIWTLKLDFGPLVGSVKSFAYDKQTYKSLVSY